MKDNDIIKIKWFSLVTLFLTTFVLGFWFGNNYGINNNSINNLEYVTTTKVQNNHSISWECEDESGAGFITDDYPQEWGSINKNNCIIKVD